MIHLSAGVGLWCIFGKFKQAIVMKSVHERFMNPDDPDIIGIYDDAPLWSVPFGMLLLDHIPMIQNARVLDIGCGTGFPMLEVAQRLGPGSRVWGIDPREAALDRVTQKIEILGIENAEVVKGKAEELPFDNNTFDLIISNNGLNNVEDPIRALDECSRTAKPGAELLFTANLPETMTEFYEVFEQALSNAGLQKYIPGIMHHILRKRKPVQTWNDIATTAGFTPKNVHYGSFAYRFASGTALLDYTFIRLAFMPSWLEIIDEPSQEHVFQLIEGELNRLAAEKKGISLSIPFACFGFENKYTDTEQVCEKVSNNGVRHNSV